MTDLLEVERENILLSVKSILKKRLVEIEFNSKRIVSSKTPGTITDLFRSILLKKSFITSTSLLQAFEQSRKGKTQS